MDFAGEAEALAVAAASDRVSDALAFFAAAFFAVFAEACFFAVCALPAEERLPVVALLAVDGLAAALRVVAFLAAVLLDAVAFSACCLPAAVFFPGALAPLLKADPVFEATLLSVAGLAADLARDLVFSLVDAAMVASGS